MHRLFCHTHTHARTHARTHTYIYTHTHARTHARTHPPTPTTTPSHTHTHTLNQDDGSDSEDMIDFQTNTELRMHKLFVNITLFLLVASAVYFTIYLFTTNSMGLIYMTGGYVEKSSFLSLLCLCALDRSLCLSAMPRSRSRAT